MSRYKKQFKPGRRFKSMAALSKALEAGRYVFITYGGNYLRLVHPSWAISMQYRVLSNFVMYGLIQSAVKNAE